MSQSSPFHFCPVCGAALDWTKGDHPVCTECAFTFYQNSSPTASVIFVNDKKEVLMSLRAVDPYKGYWDCIGGFLENGEDPVEGVKREAKEELGVEIEVLQLLDVIVDQYEFKCRTINTLNIYYLGIALSTDFKPQDDIEAVKWLPLDPLPEKLAFTNNGRILAKVKQMLEQGKLERY